MDLKEREMRQRQIFENEMLKLSSKKGHDYGESKDALYNLRMFGVHGVIVRMGDKFCRLKSFTENDKFEVQDESLRDTFIDMANYAMLALIMMDEAAEAVI